ncbi:MFS transporter [Microbacterium sp. M3]|uniref:MFS transporter n=1 Tax=Microbacterium arthrosphaerae TaxID=792652 RepID=A0ABU4H451_9MICO|nr:MULTISPECIES: MFS transporter [Microbacterium]MDW4574119.1 MFS transporter [Microbacterium arthrosphaerae]MDW7607974.1 MFS transporter [Microbacterium sp. M3]
MNDLTARVPLRFPAAAATFAIGIAGYLGVNLSPYMITALQTGFGTDVLTASWIVTATLLATAVTGLATAPLCAGRHRRLVARVGLAAGLAGFLLAGLVPVAGVAIAGLLIGGIGAGGAVAAAGSALAAFRNPDRVAGFNGLANRGVITIVLAVVPLIGLAPIDVFGALALFCLIGLVAVGWMPVAPVIEPQAGAAVAEAMPLTIPETGAVRRVPARAGSRTVTIAGFALLVTFALWAVSEDSLWAMAGVMGAERAGLTPEGLGIALSGATAGGLVGSLLLMVVGNRLGRAVPLVVLLVAGGALKIALSFAADQTTFIVLFIVWNTIYAVAFMYFVSTSAALDADGRWSGPLLAVYLVGSALTPVIGAALVEVFGYQGFVVVLGVSSFVLAIPAAIVAAISTRVEKDAAADADVEARAADVRATDTEGISA